MGRELVVVWAGRHRRDDWERLCSRYRERISHQMPVRDVAVRAKGGTAEGAARLAAEAAALRGACPDPCWTIAVDRRGKARDSAALAAWLERRVEGWPHAIAFLIGSDLGLSREVTRGARERLSLGPLTLPHELARLVLYEQLYRALSIQAGMKYHREPL